MVEDFDGSPRGLGRGSLIQYQWGSFPDFAKLLETLITVNADYGFRIGIPRPTLMLSSMIN